MKISTSHFREKRYFHDRRNSRIVPCISELNDLRCDETALEVFLHVGWVPGTHTLFEDVTCLPGGAEVSLTSEGIQIETTRFRRPPTPADVLSTATKLFDDAVVAGLSDGRTPVVPLSGGLDSRLVLAQLLRHLPPEEIITLTFGVPGSLDFDIGNAVAKRAGTKHVALDLRDRPITAERLERTASWTDANTDIVWPSVWTHIADVCGVDDVTYWTGFTGDGIGGSHAMQAGGTVDSGKRYMIEKQRRLSYWGSEFRPQQKHVALYSDGSKYRDVLPVEEAVWFENHVERYTAHHLFMHGLNYANPFMHVPLVELFLSLDYAQRKGKRLFNEWAIRRAYALFEGLPTVGYGYLSFPATYGVVTQTLIQAHWRARQQFRRALSRVLPIPHPNTTYWAMSQSLRKGGALDSLACEFIDSLARRDLIDASKARSIHEEHRRGRETNPLRVTLLLSLEAIARRFLS